VIRYSFKGERRLERKAEKGVTEKEIENCKTDLADECRCERSVETEEGVKRWWRKQLKGDGVGGGGRRVRWAKSERERSSCGGEVVVVHG